MPNKDLELRIVAKNLASAVLKTIINDLKKLSSTTGSSSGLMSKSFSILSSGLKGVGGGFKNIASISSLVFSGLVRGAGGVLESIFSLKTGILSLITTFGLLEAAKAFVNLNAEFEKMKVTMDVLTKGEGEAWFNKLNQWALTMPISMAEVTKAFITMKAYGLEPSISLMENLVNVASVLPESGRAITGIARAIGQIQAKTRLEGQELRQLAEWAVPGYEAVYTKIFKKISERTGKSVSELKFTMIDSATAIKAILETMEEHFGGTARKMAGTWSGLWIRLTNFVKEFFREIGEGGAMAPLKEQLENIVLWFESAFKTGRLQAWAEALGKVLGYAVEAIGVTFRGLFAPGSEGDIGGAAKNTVKVAIGAFYSFLKFIAYIPVAWNTVHSAILSALGTFTGSIRTLISPIVKWYNWLSKMPDIPFVNVLGKDFEKNKSAILAFDKSLGGFSDELADNKYQVDLNTAAWDKQYQEVSKNLEGLKTKSLQTMDDINKNVKPPAISDVDGGLPDTGLKGFAVEVNEIFSTLGKKTTKKPQILDDYLKWLGEVGDLTTRAKIGFYEFEQEVDKKILKNLKEYFKEFFGSLHSGFSSVFKGVLDGSLTLREGLVGIFKTIEEAFFQTISNMLAQWVVNKAIMLTKEILFQQAMTTVTAEGETARLGIEAASAVKSIAIAVASGIKKITIYAYEAAAAAFKAIAGIPFIGPFLAIGAGAAALGLVLGFASKIAGFEKGTGLGGVKETGPAVLHKGEIVLNKRESDAYRAGAMEGGGASNTTNFSFNISALDGGDVERVVRKTILPLIRENIRDNGIGRTMVREARG